MEGPRLNPSLPREETSGKEQKTVSRGLGLLTRHCSSAERSRNQLAWRWTTGDRISRSGGRRMTGRRTTHEFSASGNLGSDPGPALENGASDLQGSKGEVLYGSAPPYSSIGGDLRV